MPDHSDNEEASRPTPVNQPMTVDQARERILALIKPTIKIESVDLLNAVDRIAAVDIIAKHNIPMFRNSAMDGYAIRFRDTNTTKRFKVVGKSLAGHPYTDNLKHEEAIGVTTGAAVPNNADAIAIHELTSREGDFVKVEVELKPDQYIRNPGDDIQSGDVLIKQNAALRTADIGLLAAQGIDQIDVFQNAKVGVFSTGDELCNAQESTKLGQIFDSNRATIRTLLKKSGIESDDLGICRDDPAELEALMQNTHGYDFIISTGGVSVGEADHVKTVLEKNGELTFWKVAMKPGKPIVTGRLTTGAVYFGLPGNPVSGMVTCLQFVIPAIYTYTGLAYSQPINLRAQCTNKLRKEKGRFEFQRGKVSSDDDGNLTVCTTGLQDSHVLSSMSKANCFICLDPHSAGAAMGDEVIVIPFDQYKGLQ